MSSLVIGGAGFIGSHLVDELMTGGQEVTVIDNLSTGKLENLNRWKGNDKLEFVRQDINDEFIRNRIVDHKSWVFNFVPTHLPNLIDACYTAECKRFIDNTQEGEAVTGDWEQTLPALRLKYSDVYGPRGPSTGSIFVSDVVKANMIVAMNRELNGEIDFDELTRLWTLVDKATGAHIIDSFNKVNTSLIIF